MPVFTQPPTAKSLYYAGIATLLHFIVLTLYYLVAEDGGLLVISFAWLLKIVAAGLLAYPTFILGRYLMHIRAWVGSWVPLVALIALQLASVLVLEMREFGADTLLIMTLLTGLLFLYIAGVPVLRRFDRIQKHTGLQLYLLFMLVFGSIQVIYALAGPARTGTLVADLGYGLLEAAFYISQGLFFVYVSRQSPVPVNT
ncbi:hypothetical protein [Lewinella sp. IMCC34191]|uniref:hypothetical protein n=1 Tax=Lewinella sp. IMCC34191 TaxID=2259172 RepID=UPI000E2818F5|nr:hypothetical protein [Lewinella sp. IMCC34191]